MTTRTAIILAAVLACSAPALAQNDSSTQQTSPAVQTETIKLDDLDCAVRVMKLLSGTLKKLEKTDLSESDRINITRLQDRSGRALAYYAGRMDAGPKIPDYNAEIARRWKLAAALEVRVQSEQTLQCIIAADQGQLDFLKGASTKQ